MAPELASPGVGCGEAAIVVSDLAKWFGPHRGVDGISLKVRRGEVFGLLGPNGAGKSTVIRLILGHLRPTRGTVTVAGYEAWSDRRRIHAIAGVVPSEFSYYDSLTGNELLRLFGRLRGVKPGRRIRELSERLKADLDRPLKELSSGNRQKIGLIQALFHDPPLLVLDEPTSGLDPLMQEEFLRLIGEARDSGCTVVLSSHNMAEVERACDRVAMIREGQLLAVENVADMLQRGHRRVTITFADAAEAQSFCSRSEIEQCRPSGASAIVEIAGGLDAVLRLAINFHVVDITTDRVTLERAFVKLYEQQDGQRK